MKRQQWVSRLGVVLSVAGSAVGLGNFLRFPSVATQNGGGVFLIPYFIAFLLLGIPMCWVEWGMGRYGGKFSHGSAMPAKGGCRHDSSGMDFHDCFMGDYNRTLLLLFSAYFQKQNGKYRLSS